MKEMSPMIKKMKECMDQFKDKKKKLSKDKNLRKMQIHK